MTAGKLLLIEDRESLARMLQRALAGEGYEVAVASDGASGIARLRREAFGLVLTDLKLPGASGLEVVAACRSLAPPVPVVVMTAYGTVEAAVEAMKRGALDFLEKPVEIDDLFRLVASAFGRAPAAPGLAGVDLPAPGAATLVGSHPRFKAALHLLQRVAPSEATVLLTGESGTGKELFARALHALSPRRQGPFVALNCAAIPEPLLENELFGHQKGAFTGAAERQDGRFEQARGGTLLLDEIGELAPAVQAKVLRVLEQRTFERVGGGATVTADVRLVAATNRDLAAMVAAGRFRQDLFFRLDVFPIVLPPLRERSSDVEAIARHLLGAIARRLGREAPALAADAVAVLAAEEWPGNVRQLANVLERALILGAGPWLTAGDLAPLLAQAAGGGERERFKQALVEAAGDKRKAAERLGVSYRTLLRKVREHDLAGVPRYRSG